ncbi:MAG: DUF4350 domain-containing protein [Actinomycetota bacterium]|nr:DUF4350 domain-containing protein [Actinomycetota bacterium]
MTSPSHPPAVQAGEVMRPVWRRLRPWLALAVVVVLGALLVTSLATKPGRALDPSSAHKNGSKALAVLLRNGGTQVDRTTSLATARRADADATVLVVSPSDYSDSQLSDLGRRPGRLVLLRPSVAVLAQLAPDVRPVDVVAGQTSPGCRQPGAVAAGRVELPNPTRTYRADSATSCYDGAVLIDSRVIVLGSERLLRNDTVDDEGVAALDLNTISDNGASRRVVWLLPGAEAAGPGAPTVWQLFPAGAHRAFGWLLVLGVLLVLWRGRRLGPAVTEPLPVVVRAAEVVEGHGRLYLRAGARDRAAAALRTATLTRLGAHAGLRRGSSAADVVASAASVTGRPAGEVWYLLGGAPPADDAGLLRLAVELDALEVAAGVPPRSKGSGS